MLTCFDFVCGFFVFLINIKCSLCSSKTQAFNVHRLCSMIVSSSVRDLYLSDFNQEYTYNTFWCSSIVFPYKENCACWISIRNTHSIQSWCAALWSFSLCKELCLLNFNQEWTYNTFWCVAVWFFFHLYRIVYVCSISIRNTQSLQSWCVALWSCSLCKELCLFNFDQEYTFNTILMCSCLVIFPFAKNCAYSILIRSERPTRFDV